MGPCWCHESASPCAFPSLPAMAASSTTVWAVGGSIAISQCHYAESSISTALNSSSKEVCEYDFDDNFDEPFRNVEIEDFIVVHCDMCYRTSHGPRNCVGCSSHGEEWSESKGRGWLMPQTRPIIQPVFFFKCSEAVANSSLTKSSSPLCWTSSSPLCTAFICTVSTLSFLSSSLPNSSQIFLLLAGLADALSYLEVLPVSLLPM